MEAFSNRRRGYFGQSKNRPPTTAYHQARLDVLPHFNRFCGRRFGTDDSTAEMESVRRAVLG